MSKSMDKSFPPVFFLESIFVKNGQTNYGEESMPFYEVDIVTDVCRTMKWVKYNMGCTRYFGREKVCWYVKKYWSGWPIDRPATKDLYLDIYNENPVKPPVEIKKVDSIAFYTSEENQKIYAKLKKTRQFKPGDIVRFLDTYYWRVYTGIITAPILKGSPRKTNDESLPSNALLYKYPDKYTVMIIEDEHKWFLTKMRISIIDKIGDEKPLDDDYEYIKKLKKTYAEIKGNLTAEGKPLIPDEMVMQVESEEDVF